jgi:DNA-directed RNA polymerase subunit RPC12/RpoP
MKITTILGAVATVVLFFFGFIFLLSSGASAVSSDAQHQTIRIVEGVVLLAAACGIAYVTYIFNRKPVKIVQQLELSGQMKAATIKCPNCSASVDANRIKIVSGVPYATCPYCGTTFEVAEEPKW